MSSSSTQAYGQTDGERDRHNEANNRLSQSCKCLCKGVTFLHFFPAHS